MFGARSASPPPPPALLVAKRPLKRTRSVPNVTGGSPEFVGFFPIFCSKRQLKCMKLGGNILLAKPDLLLCSVLQSATRGPSCFAKNVKICAFWQFSRDFDATNSSDKGPEPLTTERSEVFPLLRGVRGTKCPPPPVVAKQPLKRTQSVPNVSVGSPEVMGFFPILVCKRCNIQGGMQPPPSTHWIIISEWRKYKKL